MLSRVAKIVLAKTVLKRRQSTRKLAKKLTEKGHPVSKTTVHSYMTKCLGLKKLKLRRQPKLTEAQKRKRLAFARYRKNWTWTRGTACSAMSLCSSSCTGRIARTSASGRTVALKCLPSTW